MDTTEQELLEFAQEIANVSRSPWQPCVLAEAFTRQPVKVGPWQLGQLTLRGWIALDVVRSPFLNLDSFPLEDVPERLAQAITALTGELVTAETIIAELPPVKAQSAVQALYALCAERFSCGVKIKPPKHLEGGLEIPEDGMGDWGPQLVCLMKELGMSRMEALDTPASQAMALIVLNRHNEGYRVEGQNYRMRELYAEKGEGN